MRRRLRAQSRDRCRPDLTRERAIGRLARRGSGLNLRPEFGARELALLPSVLSKSQEIIMLYTIAVVLLVLWLLGLVTSYTLGGFIHVLLILAIIAVVINLIQGRRPL
jgi:hypothetical protein